MLNKGQLGWIVGDLQGRAAAKNPAPNPESIRSAYESALADLSSDLCQAIPTQLNLLVQDKKEEIIKAIESKVHKPEVAPVAQPLPPMQPLPASDQKAKMNYRLHQAFSPKGEAEQAIETILNQEFDAFTNDELVDVEDAVLKVVSEFLPTAQQKELEAAFGNVLTHRTK